MPDKAELNETMTEQERQAVERVKRAGVLVDELTILCFVRHVGLEAILRASLRDIFQVANAF